MRLAVGALAACWSGTPASTPPSAHAPDSILARDPLDGGRLVFARDGSAWDVHCDGEHLTMRPWVGGDLVPAGTCEWRDPHVENVGSQMYRTDAIAIDHDRVARWSGKRASIELFDHGKPTRTIDISAGLEVVELAFDGPALVAVFHRKGNPQAGDAIAGIPVPTALAGVARIGPDRADVHELVAYGSTRLGVDPTYVATGPRQMLLVSATGVVVTCDYDLRCSEPLVTGVKVDGALPTGDGGLVTLAFESSASRLDPAGRLAWTTGLQAIWVVGATADEAWVAARESADGPFVIRALSLATGKRGARRGTLYTDHRESLGRYLAILGVAPTPRGAVVRGLVGGRLEVGGRVLETKRVGAVCWWETPHSGNEHDIEPGDDCDAPYQKAILTERVPFVAIGGDTLKQ